MLSPVGGMQEPGSGREGARYGLVDDLVSNELVMRL